MIKWIKCFKSFQGTRDGCCWWAMKPDDSPQGCSRLEALIIRWPKLVKEVGVGCSLPGISNKSREITFPPPFLSWMQCSYGYVTPPSAGLYGLICTTNNRVAMGKLLYTIKNIGVNLFGIFFRTIRRFQIMLTAPQAKKKKTVGLHKLSDHLVLQNIWIIFFNFFVFFFSLFIYLGKVH